LAETGLRAPNFIWIEPREEGEEALGGVGSGPHAVKEGCLGMLMLLVSVSDDDGIIVGIIVGAMVVEEVIEEEEKNAWLRPVTSWP